MMSLFSRTISCFLAACLSSVAVGGAVAQENLQPVRVILDWAWRPHHAPFAIGLERGYFKAEGIDLKVEQGRGSATAAILLGQQQFDIAHLNVTNAAQAISKGVPIQSIAVYQHKSAAAFIGVKGRVKLDDLESLKPLRIGSTPGGSDGLSLSIFARGNKMTVDQFNVVGMEGSGKTAALLQKQVDVVSGDSYAYDALVRAANEEPEIMLLADFNVPLLGFGFATNKVFGKQNPELLKRFLRAMHKSYIAAAADPAASCELLRSRFGVPGDNDACVRYFVNLTELSQKGSDPDWGRQKSEEWTAMIAAMTAVGEIKGNIPAGDYWTDEFQP